MWQQACLNVKKPINNAHTACYSSHLLTNLKPSIKDDIDGVCVCV